MSTEKPTIALLSGGLDSSVAMALAIKEGYQIRCALTFEYGQHSSTKELMHASWIADYYKVPHKTLRLNWFHDFKQSALQKGSAAVIPRPTASDLDDQGKSEESAKQVWIPNRNGVFISIAASFAEDLAADFISVGFNREEGATFPDNTPDFMEAMNGALKFSTQRGVKLISPTCLLDKKEIVKVAKDIHFPFDLLWSCYESGSKMCGTCESCMRLKRALSQSKVNFDAYFTNPAL